MTPLESRRLCFKNHTFDKTKIPKIPVKFSRAVSLENVHKSTTNCLKNNPHVNDSMRRVSSYYKIRSKAITKLLK